MKKIIAVMIVTFTLFGATAAVMAANYEATNYVGKERRSASQSTTPSYRAYADPYGRVFTQADSVQVPQFDRPAYRNYSHSSRQRDLDHTRQHGFTVVYQQQLPTRVEYQSKRQTFIQGEMNSSIESTQYTLISDWRHYGLPDPQVGMHWIFQNGRYLQVPQN